MNIGSVIIGVATSFVAWFLVFAFIRPRIVISDGISRLEAPEGDPAPYHYRIKLINRRRWRQAIIVDYKCLLRLQGMNRDYPDNYSWYVIPVEEVAAVGIQPHSDKIIRIQPFSATRLASRLDDIHAAKIASGTIRLEELLALPKAHLWVHIRCIDNFSNVHRVFSMRYLPGSVRIGGFEKRGLRLKPDLPGELDELLGDSRMTALTDDSS